MIGVKIGERHTYNDWNLILISKTIGFPSPKIETEDIPGADSSLDFSEVLTGDVHYDNRTLEFEFEMIDPVKNWDNKISEITNYLHGKKFKIILDSDPSFYYYGRVSINDFKSNKTTGTISIEADVEPYKYDLWSSLEDWLWDPFNFETGIIYETKNIEISGQKSITIVGRRLKCVPIIEVSSDMIVEFEGVRYNLTPGKQKVLDMQIKEGENTLKFIGKGIVSIDYRGGSL